MILFSIKKEKKGLSRLLRCGAVALLSVTIYIRRNLAAPVDYISVTATKQHRLDRLPGDSVDRVAFVTFSYVKHNDTQKLFDFLLPAVDTWAAGDTRATIDEEANSSSSNILPSLYVVFSQSSRDPFESLCIHGSAGYAITAEQLELCRRIQPIFVDCPEGKVGESPCCKQQKGLLELIQNRDNDYPLYDWYAFFDDDVYLRKEYLAKLLHVLQPPDFPMAAVPYNQLPNFIGSPGSNSETCGYGGMEEFRYPWGMPIFYSRGAVRTMAKGYRANSLVKECAAFGVTHDVGNAILNWMYSLPMAKLPPLQPCPNFRDDFIGSHLVGREDVRKMHFGEERKNSRGHVVKALPEGAFSFYNIHERWMFPEYEHPKISKLLTVRDLESVWYRNVTGFVRTDTFVRHGDPRSWKEGKWHVMRLEDCNLAEDQD